MSIANILWVNKHFQVEVKVTREIENVVFCSISGWRDHNYSLMYDADEIIS